MCLSPRSRHYSRILELARQEASALGAPAVGTAHLVLGLAREDVECGAGLLAGVDPDALRALLPRTPGPPPTPALSVRAAVAVGVARRRADRRGAPDLEVEDVLAAVLAAPECAGVAALERLGVDVGDLWCRTVAEPGTRPAPVARLRRRAGVSA